MTSLKNLILTISLFLICKNSWAQSIAAMEVSGSICNQLNTALSITPDGKALSVLFQEFQIQHPISLGKRIVPQMTDMMTSEVQGGNLQMVDYHYCVINLNVKELNEKIVSVTLAGDARGLVYLPKSFKGSYKIAVDYHTGLKSPSRARALVTKQYWNEADEDWTNSFSKKLNIMGACQSSVKNIMIKVMLAMSKDRKASGDAMITLDSLDNTLSSIKLNFKTAPCR